MADFVYADIPSNANVVQKERTLEEGRRYDRRRTIALGVEGFTDALRRQAMALAKKIGDRAIEQVKTEYVRPVTGKGFTDRTGDLRGSIGATIAVESDPTKIRVVLSAGMEYAVYVEKIKNGTYAYLGPALNDIRPEIAVMAKADLAAAKVAEKVKGFAGRMRVQDLIDLGRAAERDINGAG